MSYWCQEVLDEIAARGAGGYVVVFPAYRPDLVEDLALALGCRFVDFRKERMMPLGADAHRLALEAIDACVDERANAAGIVVHNAEALLAARRGEDRQRWLSAFVQAPRRGIVILPLAVFGDDAPVSERVLRLSQDSLPQESLLRQLSSLKLQ